MGFAFKAAIAQLAARRSHNPKVVSSILTGRISTNRQYVAFVATNEKYFAFVAAATGVQFPVAEFQGHKYCCVQAPVLKLQRESAGAFFQTPNDVPNNRVL